MIPGGMFYWCMECSKCVFYNIMADAESPRTVLETLYTKWEQPPKYFCLDNGCNAYNYILNREPEHFKFMEVFVDEMHWAGHKNCSPAYSTGATFATAISYIDMPTLNRCTCTALIR